MACDLIILIFIILIATVVLVVTKCIMTNFKKVTSRFSRRTIYTFIMSSCISVIIVCLILLLYGFNKDSRVYDKLSSGEVIAGILVVIPTMTTWFIEKKYEYEEKERGKIYEEYLKFYSDLDELEDINISTKIKPDQLLKRDRELELRSINYITLFLILQEKLNAINEGKESKEWRETIRIILMEIKREYLNNFKEVLKNLIIDKQMTEIKFIDFTDVELYESIPEDYYNDIEFSNCVFDCNLVSSSNAFTPGVLYKMKNCVFNDYFLFSFLLKYKNINIDTDYFYYKRDIDSGIYKKISKKELEDIANSEQQNIKKQIMYVSRIPTFEELTRQNQKRDPKCVYVNNILGKEVPINSFLLNNNFYEIILNENVENNCIIKDINTINSEILEKLSNTLEFKIDQNNSVIYRSVSKIPSDISNQDEYKWYAKNTFNFEEINDQILYIVFSIRIDKTENKFVNFIFEKDKFIRIYKELFFSTKNDKLPDGIISFISTGFKEN